MCCCIYLILEQLLNKCVIQNINVCFSVSFDTKPEISVVKTEDL